MSGNGAAWRPGCRVVLAARLAARRRGASLTDIEASARAAAVRSGRRRRSLLHGAAQRGDVAPQLAAVYLRGLIDAREALRQGGSPEAWRRYVEAIASLEFDREGPARLRGDRASAAPGCRRRGAERARRDALYLDTAIRMETLQRAAGQPGAPVIAAARGGRRSLAAGASLRRARARSTTQAAEARGTLLGPRGPGARGSAALNDSGRVRRVSHPARSTGERVQAEPPEIADARTYLRRLVCVAVRYAAQDAVAASPARVQGRHPGADCADHGVRPTPTTPPEIVHEFVNDLIATSCGACAIGSVRREIAKPAYYDLVVEMRTAVSVRWRWKPWQWTCLSVQSKLPSTGVSIFSVMSRLAEEHGAINLSQGFPGFRLRAGARGDRGPVHARRAQPVRADARRPRASRGAGPENRAAVRTPLRPGHRDHDHVRRDRRHSSAR